MTQLERMLNKFDKQSNKHSIKGGTQIEPNEWYSNWLKKNQNSTTRNFRHRICDLENLCWAGYFKF